MAAFVGGAIAVGLVAVLLGAAAILRGWVLSVLWGWFLVPFGLPPIGIAAAIGIGVVGHMLAGSSGYREKTKKESMMDAAYMFMLPMMGLLIGWFVKQFMG